MAFQFVVSARIALLMHVLKKLTAFYAQYFINFAV